MKLLEHYVIAMYTTVNLMIFRPNRTSSACVQTKIVCVLCKNQKFHPSLGQVFTSSQGTLNPVDCADDCSNVLILVFFTSHNFVGGVSSHSLFFIVSEFVLHMLLLLICYAEM